jgi:VanZ family protein
MMGQRRWLWWVWAVAVVVWTVALEMPLRGDIAQSDEIVGLPKFLVTKSLHVAAYAALTVLSALVPMNRGRWLLVVFLVLHGMGTEYGQTFVEGRSGSWRDVGLDSLGITLGVILTWRVWWRSLQRNRF